MNRAITSKRTQHSIVYGLLTVLLILWTGGAVAHYCFDGLEPPVTLHFDSLNGHDDHEYEPGHVDAEKPALSANLLSKIFELDLGILLLTTFLIELLGFNNAPIKLRELALPPRFQRALLPPLRAPPVYSC